MSSPGRSNTHTHIKRVPVPPATRLAVARLDVELGRSRTYAALGIGDGTFADATAPGGLLAPKILKKIHDALAARAAATETK